MCFIPEYSYILSTFSPFYRRIEFGTCPVCSTKHFRDYIQFIDGDERIKDLSGKSAQETYLKWKKRINEQAFCTFPNQNFYYGDFKKTKRKDSNGLPIYLQLRKNFNNQFEILNFVETKVYQNA